MTGDYQTPARMAAKLRAIPLPDMKGKRVLDVGTDHGAWCFLAAERGAVDALGLDRNRDVRGRGVVDLIAQNRDEANRQGVKCRFEHINIGKEWREFGRFDLVLVLSVFHHLYEACGDLRAVWFWLSRHVTHDGVLLWEGPLDDGDPVVRANVSADNRPRYNRDAILGAAGLYFRAEHIGPALHEPTREVWRFMPRGSPHREWEGTVKSGAGGATAAFLHADGRRCREIEKALGFLPFPGSLNVLLGDPFDWAADYYRAQVLDVAERGKGLDVEWKPRWARFYPLTIQGVSAWSFRFEGEKYNERFLELIAPTKLRDRISGPEVTIAR